MQRQTELADTVRQVRDILRKAGRQEISTSRLVDGLLAGNYRSVFRGQGMEFSELREYRPGDDVRAIDWNVTARFNRPYVKEFVEERDLRVYFVLDMSASGGFGSDVTKKARSLEVAASLMIAALRGNDGIGAVLATDRIERFVPAGKGRRQVMRLLATIVSFRPASGSTDLGAALEQAMHVIKGRSLLFVVSDFIDAGDFMRPLRMLGDRHDVVALQVVDGREREMPDVGLIELEDAETGEQMLVNTSDPSFRRRYMQVAADAESRLEAGLQGMGIDLVRLVSDQPHDLALRRFFKKRARR